MTYKEERGNLFDLPVKYSLAHCIDSYAVMGAGIAPVFDLWYPGLKRKLQKMVPLPVGSMVPYRSKCFNLVTKPSVWMNAEKNSFPNKDTIRAALECCRDFMVGTNQTLLGLPKIGCGLDRMEWDEVSEIIKDVFKDTEINIVVRYL